MTWILNIETATKTCSVSLAKNGESVQCIESTGDGFQHNEKLFVYINTIIEKSVIDFKDLNAIAVSSGPGSYTGLRIGSSAAKGLAYGLNIPLISINSLKALATLNSDEVDFIIPMFDARRMEVYTAVYDTDLNEVALTQAVVLDANFAKEYLAKGKVTFLGDGVEKSKTLIQSENAIFSKQKISAEGMAKLAFQKFNLNNFENIAYFEPNYLKEFIAGKPKKLL